MAFLTPEQFLALKSWVEDKISLHHEMTNEDPTTRPEYKPDTIYWQSKNDALDEEVRKAMCGE